MSHFRSQAGMSLLQVMIGTMLLTGLAAAGGRYFSSMSKSSRKLESSLDLSGIKAKLTEAINCKKTLEAQPNCTTSNTYVSLKDDTGRDVVSASGTLIGSYTVRARCNPGTAGGIEVRAARLTAAGSSNAAAKGYEANNSAWFARDEVNASLPYDWKHPKGMLFTAATGTTGDSRLCQEFFKGTTASAAVRCTNPGEMMVGFNPMTQTPICEPVSKKVTSAGNCGAGLVMTGIVNGEPRCVPVSTMVSSTGQCPAGQYMYAFVNGTPQCRVVAVTSPPPQPSTPPTTPPAPSVAPPTYTWQLAMDCQASGNLAACQNSPLHGGVTCPLGPVGKPCSVPNSFCLGVAGARVLKCAP